MGLICVDPAKASWVAFTPFFLAKFLRFMYDLDVLVKCLALEAGEMSFGIVGRGCRLGESIARRGNRDPRESSRGRVRRLTETKR